MHLLCTVRAQHMEAGEVEKGRLAAAGCGGRRGRGRTARWSSSRRRVAEAGEVEEGRLAGGAVAGRAAAVHASSAGDEVAWCAVGRGRATEVRRQPQLLLLRRCELRQPQLLLRAPVLLPPHREALRGPRSPSASCSSMAAAESNPKRSLDDLELGSALGWAEKGVAGADPCPHHLYQPHLPNRLAHAVTAARRPACAAVLPCLRDRSLPPTSAARACVGRERTERALLLPLLSDG
ncbi:unnamed protein product [Urochloa humidicola]